MCFFFYFSSAFSLEPYTASIYNTYSPTGVYNNITYWKNSDIPVLQDPPVKDHLRCYLVQESHCLSLPRYILPFISPASNPNTVKGRTIEDTALQLVYYFNSNLTLNGADKCTSDYKEQYYHQNLQLPNPELLSVCPMYRGNETCCINQTMTSGSVIGSFTSNAISSAQNNRKTFLYPECDELIRPFYCIMCHPNKKYMMTEVYMDNVREQQASHYYDIRVCHSFAEKLYKKCRYASGVVNVDYGRGWIVEPGMGYNDFLKKLHIDFLNQTDNETVDHPGINCWDYSAGFISSKVSYILVSIVASLSLVAAFF